MLEVSVDRQCEAIDYVAERTGHHGCQHAASDRRGVAEGWQNGGRCGVQQLPPAA